MRNVFVAAIVVMTVMLGWMIWVDPGWLFRGSDDWRNGFLTGVVIAMLASMTLGFFRGFFGAMWHDIQRGEPDDDHWR